MVTSASFYVSFIQICFVKNSFSIERIFVTYCASLDYVHVRSFSLEYITTCIVIAILETYQTSFVVLRTPIFVGAFFAAEDCPMSGSERCIGQSAGGRDGPPSHAPHPRSFHGGLSLILFYMTNIGIKCKLQ